MRGGTYYVAFSDSRATLLEPSHTEQGALKVPPVFLYTLPFVCKTKQPSQTNKDRQPAEKKNKKNTD